MSLYGIEQVLAYVLLAPIAELPDEILNLK